MPPLDPREIEARGRALYGRPLGPARGVLHVVAVAETDSAETDSAETDSAETDSAETDAGWRVIAIGPHAPRSSADRSALELARARVDAVLISGSVLRAETELRYELDGAWLLVLTRRGELPSAHPIWQSDARILVYAATDTPLELPPHVEIVRSASPSAREAIRHLREDRACASVSVEAGPSVARALYEPPIIVDELMLSVFSGPLDPRATGGALPIEEPLARSFSLEGGPTVVDEPSGRWTFARYVNRGRRGTAEGSR